MKSEILIRKRINRHQLLIDKFRADKDLPPKEKRSAIYTLQQAVRELKWVLKY